MYQQYFGLSDSPFSIAPDPRYLFLSDKHREALAHLLYGVGDQGGFVLLTGEVGTGKTTICRCLLQQLPSNVDIAFIINPKQSINQLLQSICSDFDIGFARGDTSRDLIEQLNHYLLAAHAKGRNTILVIDEAQNLSADVLEQLRLLTNLETNEKKLLQLVLIGQPELNELLARNELRQLAQRVTARYHLGALSKAEVGQYIEHRLSIAGCRSELFSAQAISKIYQLTKGVPRLINLICDRSLLGLYATHRDQADQAIVAKAATEVFPLNGQAYRHRNALVTAALLLLGIVLLVGLWQTRSPSDVLADTLIHSLDANKPVNSHPPWQLALANSPSLETSLSNLYKLWGGEGDSATTQLCSITPALQYDLYCQAQDISFEQLRHGNYPAVLWVTVPQIGDNKPLTEGYFLLQSMDEQQAYIVIDDQYYRLATADLMQLSIKKAWRISRLPELALPIGVGDTSAGVAWLRNSLAAYIDPSRFAPPGQRQINTLSSQGPNRSEYLYSHYLRFDDAALPTVFDEQLWQSITAVQNNLGFKANAQVDQAFLYALQQWLHPNDPVLDSTQSSTIPSIQEG